MSSESDDVGEPSEALFKFPTLSGEEAKDFKKFVIHGLKNNHLRICPFGSDEATFYAPISPFKREFDLHTGGDKEGPVLGHVRFGYWRDHIIGIGDRNTNANSMTWEKMVRTSKWDHDVYEIDFDCGAAGRKSFTWKRVHYRPWKTEIQFHFFETGKPDVVLAQYNRDVASKKIRRQVLIREGYDDSWKVMVWLTLLAVIELARRQ